MEYDVIVIGAGMAGLLTAYYLQKEGKKVLVLEADEIASGQTGRTTAKITSQHDLKYSDLADKVGMETAKLYAKANEEAIDEYERLIKKENIECQFQRVPAYLYTTDPKNTKVLKDEADLAFLFGINTCVTKETELPFPVEEAVCFLNQAQFQADAFVAHIGKKLKVKEDTKVVSIRGDKVITKERDYIAKSIVIATHYPLKNFPGFYFLRQHQERSYVLELSGCEKIEGMYYGIDKEGLSLRQRGDRLLLGGCSRRTGENTCKESYEELAKVAKMYFPEAKIEEMWSAQDCMPHDGIPFIGKYSIFTPNLYVATGFQKWGMSTSMVAALLLRDEICGKENPYRKVFSPQRLHIRAGGRDFFKDVGISAKGLWNGIMKKNMPRCSHLGCGLHFHLEEGTWECPCHGSRFDEDGKLLDNPAKYDILVK